MFVNKVGLLYLEKKNKLCEGWGISLDWMEKLPQLTKVIEFRCWQAQGGTKGFK
jgi:hypothetical protein